MQRDKKRLQHQSADKQTKGKTNIMTPKYLYHFTSYKHYFEICNTGQINLTCSNLLPPDKKTARIDANGNYRDDNDSYKPVVWFTTDPTPKTTANGLYKAKTAVRLTVEFNERNFIKWRDFADTNKMNRTWRAKFEKGGDTNNWYVTTQPVPISAIIARDFF